MAGGNGFKLESIRRTKDAAHTFHEWIRILERSGLIQTWRGRDNEFISYEDYTRPLFNVFFNELLRSGVAKPGQKDEIFDIFWND